MLKIDHLGIAVRNIAEVRGFYESLGLAIQSEEVVQQEGVRAALIPVGDSCIELLEPLSEGTPVAGFLARRGEGMHHLAFQVADIAVAFERMRESGAKLVSDRIQAGAGGHLYFFVHPSSAGGVLVEICQHRLP